MTLLSAPQAAKSRPKTLWVAAARALTFVLGVWARQRVFLAVAGAYCFGGTAFLVATGQTRFLQLNLYAPDIFLLAILVVAASRLLVSPVYRRAVQGREAARAFLQTETRRLIQALPALVVLPLVTSMYTSIKSSLLDPHGATFDPLLAEIDRALHGGIDAWAVIQPVFGHTPVTHVLDAAYVVWFAVLIAVVLWQAFRLGDARGRAQFLITLVLIWSIVGNLFAGLLISGGPAYYAQLTGDAGRFAPLFDYLGDLDVFAMTLQDKLWAWHVGGGMGAYHGISAMPSVHVAISVLLALAGGAHRDGSAGCCPSMPA